MSNINGKIEIDIEASILNIREYLQPIHNFYRDLNINSRKTKDEVEADNSIPDFIDNNLDLDFSLFKTKE